MRRSLIVCLVSIGLLLSTNLPVQSAAPHRLSLPGAMDFSGPNRGWVEISSSAAYDTVCQQGLHPPAACSTAVTKLFETTDGGRTWTQRLRLAGPPLEANPYLPEAWIHTFLPSTVLFLPFATAPNGHVRLYRSTDGGRSWTSGVPPRSEAYLSTTDVAFAGPNRLWLLRHDGAAMGSEQVSVFATEDAGTHWVQTACTNLPVQSAGCRKPSGISFSGHKNNIVFASPSHGWITESDASGIPSLYVTHDGGYHWKVTHPGLPRGIPASNPKRNVFPYAEYERPIAFGSFVFLPTIATLCTNGPRGGTSCQSRRYALLSLDGGRTWSDSRQIPSSTNATSSSPWQVMTSSTWWSVAGSSLSVTNDTGKHWRSIVPRIPGGLKLLRVQFVTDTDGWAIAGQTVLNDTYARNVRLLRTIDGGRNWTEVRLPGSVS